MRQCAVCGADDQQVVESFDDNLKPVYNHFVMIDAYPLDKGKTYVTPQEQKRGFSFKIIDGKPAKFRYVCRNCFVEQERTVEYRREMRRGLARKTDDKRLRNSYWVQHMMLND